MTELAKHPSTEPIGHMEFDMRRDGFVLYSSTSSMYTIDLKGKGIYQLTDFNGQSNTNITLISSFAQLNRDWVLLIDIGNHCVKLMDRFKNTTEPFIGTCGLRGYRNGLFGDALFNYPYTIVPNPTRTEFFLTENYYIRRIEFHDIHRVYKQLAHEQHVILGLAIDFYNGIGYYTTTYRLHKFLLATSENTISQMKDAVGSGDRDGCLKKSKYNHPDDLAFLDSNTLLLNDRKNLRLRVLNLKDGSSSSICKNLKTDETVYGHFSECHLAIASSLLPMPTENKVLIGDKGSIVQLELQYSG